MMILAASAVLAPRGVHVGMCLAARQGEQEKAAKYIGKGRASLIIGRTPFVRFGVPMSPIVFPRAIGPGKFRAPSVSLWFRLAHAHALGRPA